MMKTLTIDELLHILITCAGEEDLSTAGDDVADQAFADLGYDSLALMEAAAHIEQEYGVRIPDETLMELTTPRALLAEVNGHLAASR
jgi:minimal PKS acyl carrier protein